MLAKQVALHITHINPFHSNTHFLYKDYWFLGFDNFFFNP